MKYTLSETEKAKFEELLNGVREINKHVDASKLVADNMYKIQQLQQNLVVPEVLPSPPPPSSSVNLMANTKNAATQGLQSFQQDGKVMDTRRQTLCAQIREGGRFGEATLFLPQEIQHAGDVVVQRYSPHHKALEPKRQVPCIRSDRVGFLRS